MTYTEYLAAEAASDLRHEFLNGEVWAMVGGTPEHAALAAALIAALGAALRGKPCRVYTSDLRVRIRPTGLSTYPDVSVVCGSVGMAPEDPDAITNPVVVAEVLSDTTEAYDRGAKAAHYRRLPSIQEYILVSQAEPLVEVYRRAEPGRWELLEGRAGDIIELRSLGISLDVAAVYANPLVGQA
jgi:Uma2 family endonuclease